MNQINFGLKHDCKIFFLSRKSEKAVVFSTLRKNFKIIVIDLQSSFFDVGRKGDVHENVLS